LAEQVLHQDIRGNDDDRHGKNAGQKPAGHLMIRFVKVADTWPA
jgi:hypothetical protein